MSYEKEYRHCLENTNKRELVDKIIYDEKEFIKKDKEIERLNKENKQPKDNWNKLNEYIKTEIPEDVFINTEWFVSILDKMQELEGSDSNE